MIAIGTLERKTLSNMNRLLNDSLFLENDHIYIRICGETHEQDIEKPYTGYVTETDGSIVVVEDGIVIALHTDLYSYKRHQEYVAA